MRIPWYLTIQSAQLPRWRYKLLLTYIQIWYEFGHGFPCEVHGSNTLPEERKPRPSGVLYQVP